MQNKSLILENIKKTREAISKTLNQINGGDCLRVMHSIIEAFDNELVAVQRNMVFFDKQNDLETIAAYRNSLLHYHITLRAIEYLLYNLQNQNSTLSETPLIDTRLIVSEYSVFPTDDEMLTQKYNVGHDECISNDVDLLGGAYKARRYYIVKNFYRIEGRNQIGLAMKFMQEFWTLMSLKVILYSNISIEISEDGKIMPVDLTPEIILELDEIHARQLGVEHNRFPSWRLGIKKMYELTLAASSRDRTSSINRDIMFKGFRMELAEFGRLKNFPEIFLQKYSIEFQIYSSIIQQIISLAYSSKMTCVYLPKSRLIAKIVKGSNCKRTVVEKVVNSLIWTRGKSIVENPIIHYNFYCMYSWTTIAYGLLGPIYRCYDELVDNDLKGKIFEDECRHAFRVQNSDFVFNDRLLVNRPILPQEISVKLWGYIKKRTDLDVLAVNNGVLFLLECKSRKTPSSRKIRIENLFEKYYNELLYKANWIAQNFEQFKQIAACQNCILPEDCKYVVSLLISNLLIVKNPKLLVNNITELVSIIKNVPDVPQTPKFELLLESHVKIFIPVFEIKPSPIDQIN